MICGGMFLVNFTAMDVCDLAVPSSQGANLFLLVTHHLPDGFREAAELPWYSSGRSTAATLADDSVVTKVPRGRESTHHQWSR